MQGSTCNLNECFLCRHCLPEWKQLIALNKETLLVKKGKLLFEEGQKVKGMYFLVEGLFKIHMQWGTQKELILRFTRPGDILGHRGLGPSDTYPISATALQDSRVCFITNAFLESTLKTNPSFTYQLLQVYTAELHHAERRMRNLAHMEVKGRIADALLELAAVFGLGKNQEVGISLSRQDLASYAGTTYETLFKLFTEFTRSGIIASTGKDIRILSPEALQALAAKRTP